MNSLLIILVVIVMVIGLVGTFMPLVPGVPLIFAAILFYGWYEGFVNLDTYYLLIMGALTLLTLVADYLSAILGAKYFGSSRMGLLGALLGTIIGFILFPPVGIFVGPWLGAIIFEYLSRKDFNKAMKAGIGTVIGLLSGIVFKIIVGLIMIISFAAKLMM